MMMRTILEKEMNRFFFGIHCEMGKSTIESYSYCRATTKTKLTYFSKGMDTYKI